MQPQLTNQGGGAWCSECHGYTHTPFCSQYDAAKDDVPGDQTATHCCNRCDEADRQEREQVAAYGESMRRRGLPDRPHQFIPQEYAREFCDYQPSPDSPRCNLSQLNTLAHEIEDQRRAFYVSAPAIRMALADVIDAGDDGYHGLPWLFHHDETPNQTAERVRFIDRVITRLQQLRENSLSPKLENYCSRHRSLRLPRPSTATCADCERERVGVSE